MKHADSIFHAEQALRGDLDGWIHDHTEQEGDCLIWQGGYSNSGRTPSMVMPRALPAKPGKRARRTGVNKVVWEQFHGKAAPKGWSIWNTCGDSRCVNPLHLRCSTRKEMMRNQVRLGKHQKSAVAKKKMAIINRERTGVTWDDVTRIRQIMSEVSANRGFFGKARHDRPGRQETMRRLAAEFGMSFHAIRRIVEYRSWADAPPANQNPFAQLMAA